MSHVQKCLRYVYRTEFKQSEQTARERNLGLWGRC